MTFTISAWASDGRTVVKRTGPLKVGQLVDWADDDGVSGGRVRTDCADVCRPGPTPRKFSSCLPTAGRANPTLGNLLHADMCADPGEARW